MNETTFTRQFMQDWQRQRPALHCQHLQKNRVWYHKIADPTYGGNVTNTRAVDVIACFGGVCVGMEWKLKKDTRAFPIKRIREGQIETLRAIEQAHGIGFIMIAVYLGPREKCVYAIPIERWLEVVVRTTTRKSICIETEFANCRIEMHSVGTYRHWKVRPIEQLISAVRLKNFYLEESEV